MKFKLTYRNFGEHAVLIEWPEQISQEILHDIMGFKHQITKEFSGSIVETIIGFNSMTVLAKAHMQLPKLIAGLKKLRKVKNGELVYSPKIWEMPVCYDVDFAIDMDKMCEALNLSTEELIKIHTEPTYLLHFIGFVPGFMYLGGLDSRLHYPRREKPRPRVLKGAVAIGGQQTGIYPKSSPAGWNIIGNSPIELFDVTIDMPCFANPGDFIRFRSITQAEYVELQHDVELGRFDPESLKINA